MKEVKTYENDARKFVIDKPKERIIIEVGNNVIDIESCNPKEYKDRVLIDIYPYKRAESLNGIVTIGIGNNSTKIALEAIKS